MITRIQLADRYRENSDTGCWEWLGQLDKGGYGIVKRLGRRTGAHRVSYEIYRGPIPAGLQIDHLCRNRKCVNPAHLEAVTQQENIRRGTSQSVVNAAKTHCVHGHEFTPSNTGLDRGKRYCRVCDRARCRAQYRARVLAVRFGATNA